MKKSFFVKNIMKIALSGILLVCVIFAAPAYGWFASSYSVQKDTELLLDGSMVASSRFDAYKFNDEEGRAIKIADEDDITLPLYDTVFTERNENSTLIFRVPVFGTEIDAHNAFRITLDLQDRSEETGNTDNNFKDGIKTADVPETAVADYVSNVIYVKCAVIGGDLQKETVTPPPTWKNDDADDYLYNVAHEFFKDSANASAVERNTFVTSETVEGRKVYSKEADSISFTVKNYQSLMADNASILYVYIEIGYDVDLIENMTTTRNAAFAFDGDEKGIPIESDLQDFIFSAAIST